MSINVNLTLIPIESEPGKLFAPTADPLTVSFIGNFFCKRLNVKCRKLSN